MPKGALSTGMYDEDKILPGMLQNTNDYLRDSQSATAQAGSALEEAIRAYQGARPVNTNLRFAASMLKPTRTGSFGEELGNGLTGLADADDTERKEQTEKMVKIASIREGIARLKMGQAGTSFNARQGAYKYPEQARDAREAIDDIQNPIDIPIPGMPSGRAPSPTAPSPSQVGTEASQTAVPVAPGRAADMARRQQQFAPETVQAPAPGGAQAAPGIPTIRPPVPNGPPAPEGMFDGSQQDFLNGKRSEGVDPAMAKNAQYAVDNASQPDEMVDWARKVQAAAAGDPDRWSRSKKGKAALAQANHIITESERARIAKENLEVRREGLDLRRDIADRRGATSTSPTDHMRSELADKRLAIATLKDGLRNFKSLVDKTGAEMLPTEDRATLETTYKDLQMKFKDAYKLGAITGPDMQILESILMDPTINKWQDLHKAWNPSGRIGAQIKTISGILDRSMEIAEKSLGASGEAGKPDLNGTGGDTAQVVRWGRDANGKPVQLK